jgi:mRNA-degrading endonuclease RelE of RelBE toxin-antitoxin system
MERLISKLHPQIKTRPRGAIAQVLSNPQAGKPLQQDLAGFWSLRTGRFRLIYRIRPERIVEIIAFGPRKTIYEETSRLLARGKS